jgi:hypothetical protein
MRLKKIIALLPVLCAFLGCPAGGSDEVKVTTRPQPIYIERGAAGQYLNFDFVVENLTGGTVTLSKIVVSVYDSRDTLLLQRYLDNNGFSPSIEIIPDRAAAPKQSLLVFNPFHVFSPEMELGRLRYEFTFDAQPAGKQYKTEVAVTPVDYRQKTDLVLPLKGRLLVFDGHDFYAHHRRLNYLNPAPRRLGVDSNFMRYAEDFCVVNDRGEKFEGDENNLNNWFGFGAPVYATGGGRVVALSDGLQDSRTFDDSGLADNPMMLYGNYVVIDHGGGEFSMFGHLRQSSIGVRVGDVVTQGQQIAQVGSTGSAYFPHLHYEMRTGTGLKVEGLPSYFRGFRRLLGASVIEVKSGPVETGEIVEGS